MYKLSLCIAAAKLSMYSMRVPIYPTEPPVGRYKWRSEGSNSIIHSYFDEY